MQPAPDRLAICTDLLRCYFAAGWKQLLHHLFAFPQLQESEEVLAPEQQQLLLQQLCPSVMQRTVSWGWLARAEE